MDKTQLIHRVLTSKATAVEQAELNEWISRDPGNAREYDDIKFLYEGSQDIEHKILERDEHFYDGFRNIERRIEGVKRRNRRSRLFKVAGIAIMAAGLALMAITQLFTSGPSTENSIRPSDGKHTGTVYGVVLSDNLKFENVTIESIIGLLEGRYDLVFVVTSKRLLSCRFTGTFYQGTSVVELINTLALSADFDFNIINAHKYALSGNGCDR